MDQLYPEPESDVDVVRRYADDDRPPSPGMPWVMVNMVASVDGATAVDGVSGGLGGSGDRAVFRAIRAVADAIVVASGTAMAEDYGPARVTADIAAMRMARGQQPNPMLAVVSGRLALDPGSRLLSTADDATPVLVMTHDAAPADARARIEQTTEVVSMGASRVDLRRALSLLHDRGARVVLVEGGPSLNGQFVAIGAIDELCMTVAPMLVGGTSARLAHGDPPADPTGMRLERVLHESGSLFLRYVRRR